MNFTELELKRVLEKVREAAPKGMGDYALRTIATAALTEAGRILSFRIDAKLDKIAADTKAEEAARLVNEDYAWRRDLPRCRYADDGVCIAKVPEACICTKERA